MACRRCGANCQGRYCQSCDREQHRMTPAEYMELQETIEAGRHEDGDE